nr:DJ-1/PfpI family protein [uncultured Caldimonas sp.]
MKTFGLVVFDDFTDIDLFLMWDILGRNRVDWQVRVLGTAHAHRSAHGLMVPTQGRLQEACEADVVLFTSGKAGVPAALADEAFTSALQGANALDPRHQLLGSICAGAFVLAHLGLLSARQATTHPDAAPRLRALGIEVLDQPLVCRGNVATAGGCLSALYLTGWAVQRLFGPEKRRQTLRELLPAGQERLFEELIDASIEQRHSSAGSAQGISLT